MNPIRRIRRIAGILAGLACAGLGSRSLRPPRSPCPCRLVALGAASRRRRRQPRSTPWSWAG